MEGTQPEPVPVLQVGHTSEFAEAVATALEGADERFTVETARSVDEGWARLGGTVVDCIVSAYDLSDLDGIEFLETVRQGYPDLPFILYTDAGSEAVASEAISAGVTDYVRRKSEDDRHADLASRVRNAVAAYRETRNRKARATAIEETIDGIAILDENGTFRYVNQAHADIYGYDDPQSFIGNTWRMCYSDDALERFDETVVPALHEKGAWRGELEGTRTDGRTFPQELSLSRLDDGRVISVVRDVTARKERKRKLTTLHDVADDLATSTTVESVCERTIEASQDILEFDLSVIDVEADGVLAKTAVSADMPMENMTDMSVTEGIAGKTYRTGESFLVHDVRTVDEANPQGPYRSVISVPIGDHGVFQAVDETTGAFDETDLELAELLISHTESALDRLEHKRELRAFREAVQHTDHVVYWTDPDGTIEYVNPAFETQTGYAAEEAIGENPRILKSGEHDASFYEGLWDAILAGETWHSEVVNEREDGSRYVVEQTITPIVTDDGDVERFVAINTDVTERKRRERALAALHETATELEEATTEEDVYERLIEAAEKTLDFDLVAVDVVENGALVQQAWTLETDNEGYYLETPLDEDTLATRAYHRGETIVVDDVRNDDVTPADPEYRSVLTVPIGEIGTFQTVSRKVGAFDETDRELAELLVDHAQSALRRLGQEQSLRDQRDRLRRENERLERFASMVSHDLRNPLTVARGELELARGDRDSGRLEAVETSLDRMASIIESVLTMARGGQAVEADELEWIDLERLGEECWRTVETGDADLDVTTDAAIKADGDRLKQVFENLFRNAVEHGGETVTITVGTLDGNGFYVADDGRGIPETERDRVFDSGYSTTAGGTGFGLAIVKEVVEAHDWDVAVTEGEDGGTRFEITGVEFAD